eukprot:CAMPEP_0182479326 /NCGR_PEP_ID=MMETSP1319-20130603/33976_1 /TAXON_ID=172717 /ORGANISM="Bolidomonas pacifica, Strain RCC208" /LENGTH=89 /DNA_ID=CAMNT_0024680745 /DNA_START=249 /DNA_END=518 /DNA_ORIENTATION=-
MFYQEWCDLQSMDDKGSSIIRVNDAKIKSWYISRASGRVGIHKVRKHTLNHIKSFLRQVHWQWLVFVENIPSPIPQVVQAPNSVKMVMG